MDADLQDSPDEIPALYNMITGEYGYKRNSWEANTTPKTEAFWQFTDPNYAKIWLNNGGVLIKNK